MACPDAHEGHDKHFIEICRGHLIPWSTEEISSHGQALTANIWTNPDFKLDYDSRRTLAGFPQLWSNEISNILELSKPLKAVPSECDPHQDVMISNSRHLPFLGADGFWKQPSPHHSPLTPDAGRRKEIESSCLFHFPCSLTLPTLFSGSHGHAFLSSSKVKSIYYF